MEQNIPKMQLIPQEQQLSLLNSRPKKNVSSSTICPPKNSTDFCNETGDEIFGQMQNLTSNTNGCFAT